MKKTCGLVYLFLLVLVLPRSGWIVAAENLLSNPGLDGPAGPDGCPAGWSHWAPAENLSPRFSLDRGSGAEAAGALMIQATGRSYTMGRWQTSADRIKGGRTYRCEFSLRTENIPDPGRSIRVVLHWLGTGGEEAALDYVDTGSAGSGWSRIGRTIEAPERAAALRLELYLRGDGLGSAWFDDLSLVETDPVPHRRVRLGTIWLQSWDDGTPEENVERFAGWLEKAGEAGCDAVCLPEAITSFCVPREKQRLSPIPGPVSDRLGQVARRYRMHVVACYDELLDGRGYNSAIWIDRDGAVRGKYHKTHLPFTEFERGLVPGDEYPVFQTDFGVIGMEICYDNFFPEVARSLRLNGAELIFLPIWGDERADGYIWDIMARARAIDNGVYLVACKYSGGRSLIVDPEGKILADSRGLEGLITADIDLDKRFLTHSLGGRGLGDWRELFIPERRPETYFGMTEPF